MASLKRVLHRTLIASTVALILAGCGEKTAQEAYQDAQSLYQQQQLDSAIIELKHAIQQAPRDPNARFLLGKIYLEQQQFAPAEKELERARELGYSAAEVIPLLSEAYQRNGTLLGLERIERTDSNLSQLQEVQVGFYQAQSLLELNKPDEAKALISDLQLLSVDSVYRQLVDVLALLQDEEFDGATTSLQSILDEYPESIDALNILTRIYLSQNEKALAAPILEQYLQVAKNDLEKEFVYAQLLFEIGEATKAQPHVSKLLEIAPKNPRLHQLQSMIHAHKQDFEQAYTSAEQALTLGLDNGTIRFVAGYSAFMQRRYAVANEHLSTIASEFPDNHPGIKMLAATQLELGQSLEANRILSRYTNINEQDAALFTQMGYELYRDGHIEQARAVTKQLDGVAREPLDQAKLGALKLQLQDIEGVANIEAAVNDAPDSDLALETLSRAYVSAGQYEDALSLAERWQATAPENFKAYLLEGEAALRTDDLNRAQKAFETAKTKAPDVAQTHLALVNIFMEQQDYAGAHALVEQTLKQFPNNINAIAAHYALVNLLQKAEDGLAPLRTYLATGLATDGEKILAAQLMLNEQLSEEAETIIAGIEPTTSTPRAFWPTKAGIFLQNKELDALALHYDQWLETLPFDIDGFIGRLIMFELIRDFDGGLELLEKHPQLAKNTTARVLHSHFSAQVKDVRNARKIYDLLPQDIKSNANVKGLYARILLLEGRHTEALEPAAVAYDARQTRDNFMTLYDALRLNNQADKADALLTQYASANPNDTMAKLLIAQNNLQDDPQLAIAKYKAVINKHPTHFVALNNLAHLMAQQSEYDEALTYAERALEQAPNNVAVLDTVAQIYVALNAPDMALGFYEKAFEQDVKNSEIVLNYIETLLQNNQSRVAQRTIEQHEFNDRLAQDRLNVLKAKYNL